ncbi:phage tail assembly chaperone [Alloalcanivorax xenomutans]|uniref:phage tail assembly chaperone n=1 Tax=Alloalcanivorax xenomutans TaxID=1094342 RepID=UPI003B9691B5
MSKRVYCFDYATGRYTGRDEALPDPEGGQPMVPGNATLVAPPQPSSDGEVAVWRSRTASWELVPDYVEEDVLNDSPLSEEQLATAARRHRNGLLRGCDWTQVPDSPLGESERQEWQMYRQALREVPEQEGFPTEINWPASPASN